VAIQGATSATYTVTQTGAYTADIKDGTCTAKASNTVNVTVTPAPRGTISPATGSICTGEAITLTATGGTSYQWYRNGAQITGAITSTYPATQGGTFAVDIINGNCKAKASNESVITVNALPTGSISPATATICAGGSTTLTATGGTSYQWYKNNVAMTGATAATYNATEAGTYTVDIVNSNGCKAKASNNAVVTTGTSPTGTITPASGVLCGATAPVLLTASGGTSYQWYKDGIAIAGATAATYSALLPGTYSADIISATCKGKASNEAVISTGSVPTGAITPLLSTICQGGSQVLTATGGTSYQWLKDGTPISGATSATYTATAAGIYSVVLSNGSCSAPIASPATVVVTPAPSGTITPAATTICTGGSQTLTATGGTTYQWYKDGVAIQGATAATYSAIQAGTYTADIINNTCSAKATNSATVTVTTAPSGPITPATASICTGGSTTLTVSGGSTYQWYKDGVIINGATSATYNATAAGTYTADIISGACKGKSTNSAVITAGATPSGSITPTSGVLCGSGSNVVLTATGGTTYQWLKDGTAISGATAATYTATATGVYSADIISGGCTGRSTNTAVITSGTLPTGTIAPSTASICPGGSQVLTVTGGSSYQWSKDGTPIAGATTSTYTATQPGTYRVVIFNSTCSAPATNTATVTLATAPSGSISPATAAICTGSSQLLTATGGTSYQWYKDGVAISGATTGTYSVTESGLYTADIINGTCRAKATNSATVTVSTLPTGTISPATASICAGSHQLLTASGGSSYQWYKDGIIINGATAATFNATQSGNYTVDIISSSGCKAKATNQAVIVVNTIPSSAIVPASVTLCTGGSATLTTSGGTSYQWYKDGVAITGATTATYNVTQAGTYTADVIGGGGCKAVTTNSSTVTIGTTPSGSITPAAGVLCSTGSSVVLTVGGGTTYQWYKDGVAITGATGSTYTATATGSYTADIRSGTCTGKSTNTAVVTQVAAPAGTIVPASGSICQGTSVLLTANGGTAYQWFRNGVAIPGATTATYNATQIGTYSATIFSGTCSAPATNNAVIAESVLTFRTTTTDPGCLSPTGSITVTNATGGTGIGYLYSKDNGINYQTENTFKDLPAGNYFIVIKDVAGCKSNPVTVAIKQFTSTLSATVTVNPVTCVQATGSATVAATGGTAPYTYSMNGGTFQASNTFTNLATGAYKITVKDAAGCTFEASIVITQVNSNMTATVATTDPTCDQPGGTVTITATGGTPDYTYSLDGGAFQAANTFTNLTPGAHTVTVKDKPGCSSQVSFEIRSTGRQPNLVITNPPVICTGSTADLQSSSVTAGSDAGLTFTYWTDANATTVLTNPGAVTAGTYYIKATNTSGCTAIKPVVVASRAATPGRITASGPTVACNGQSLTLTASSGRSYQWYKDGVLIPGATAGTYAATAEGAYSVSINDGTCTVMAVDTVRVQFQDCSPIPETKVFVPTAFTPNQNNANDVLRPLLYNVKELRYFRVYNRWGQEVFQTNQAGKGWDGTLKGVRQPAETYSWTLECIDMKGNIIKQSGRSLLIR
jgi:gliding motility-associated-like protein